MKKIGFLLFLPALLFAASSLPAQPVTFLRMYGNGNSGYAVRVIAGDDCVVAGGTDFYHNYHWQWMSPAASTNIHLFRTNATGTLTWEKIYSLPGYRTMARWMEPASDGGFIVACSRNADLSWPPDSNDVVLLKTDAGGNVQWSRVYDTGKDDLGFCVQPTVDGGYIVAAFHDSLPVSLAGSTFVLMIKTDSNGNVLWNRKIGIAVRDFDTGEAFPCAIRQASDSGYIVTGTTSGLHQADAFVFRTDPAGNLLWTKSYEHGPSSFRLSTGADLVESTAGEIIVAGSMDKDRSLFQYNYPYLLRLSSTGLVLDAGIYDSNPASAFQSGFSSVQQTPDGGFFFTGMGGYGGFGDQAQLLKTNALLAMQWSRVYTWDGLATMGARSARYSSDGGYVFTGKRQFDGTVLMKTGSTGLIPCKTPGTLSKILPALLLISRTPSVATGVVSNPVLFSVLPALTDTQSTCPETSFPLPVEFMTFEARPNGSGIVLTWETATETNCDFFAVERSRDGIEFEETGRVQGSGQSTVSLRYLFADEKPYPGTSYYRLRQVDYDGSHVYSATVVVNRDEPGLVLLSLPQAGSGDFTITFSSASDKRIALSLFDAAGRIVQRGEVQPGPGVNRISWSGCTPGVYVLSLRQGANMIRVKIVF